MRAHKNYVPRKLVEEKPAKKRVEETLPKKEEISTKPKKKKTLLFYRKVFLFIFSNFKGYMSHLILCNLIEICFL